MALQGSLEELPLPDVIQLLAVGAKTGAFELRRSGELGTIFLRRGEIVHAKLGELEGEEAVYALAIWPQGEFLFQPGVEPATATIDRSNTSLLMEAARRTDEWKVLVRKIPSTRLIPVLVQPETTTSISLTRAEWALACRSDGQRSIEGIATAVGLAPFEVCRILYGLVTTGLIELREPVAKTPSRSSEPPVASSPPAAAAPPAAPPSVPRPALNLREETRRLAGVVYQALGPEGEAQAIKIERAASLGELLTALERSRDLLRRVGKNDMALQLGTEIDQLKNR